jgi:hypothetical protein
MSGDRSRRRAWPPRLLEAGLAALVLTSCLESVHVDILGATARPVHVLALAWTAYLLRRRRARQDGVVGLLLVTALAVAVLSIPPLLAHRDSARMLLPGLILVNLWIMGIAYEAFLSTGPGAREAVTVALSLLVLYPIVQYALALLGLIPPFPNGQFSPVGRPPGTFEEGTWVAIVAAFSAVWAIGNRRRLLLVMSLATNVMSASRTALLALLGAVSRLLPAATPGARLSQLFVGGILAVSLLLTPVSLILVNPTSDASSLDTRVLDQKVVLESLSGNEWLVGGDETVLRDPARSRNLPATANNVYIDFLWKQGVFGVAVLAILMLMLIAALPRSAGLPARPWRQPALQAFISLVVAMSVANNALLRPWLWVLAGVTLAVLSSRSSAPEAVPEPAS